MELRTHSSARSLRFLRWPVVLPFAALLHSQPLQPGEIYRQVSPAVVLIEVQDTAGLGACTRFSAA